MGVTYSACERCGDVYYDGSRYRAFCETCESCFCSDECGETLDAECESDKSSCVFCRYEDAPDRAVMDFVLEKLGTTMAVAKAQYLASLKENE